MNVEDTVVQSGLLNAIGCSIENYPELRLKLLYKLDDAAHIATSIVLMSPEELVYEDIFQVTYSPTHEEIMPEIVAPLVEQIRRNQSKISEVSTKLISMPIFTKSIIDDLPSLRIAVPFKPNEFDSNEFLQCLAMDLGIDRNDMFLISVEEGSTKYKIKFKAAISLCSEKMKQIAGKIKMIVLPSSKSAEFITKQKSSGAIEDMSKIEVGLDNVVENADLTSTKTLAPADIDVALALMERPAIIDPPIWEYLTQKSRKISSGILHAFQASTAEYVIESMSLVHNEELYCKYNACTVHGEEKLLFHGTKLHNLDCIFEMNFKTFYTSTTGQLTDSGWFGQGTYFSSSPQYCATYAGSGSTGIMYLICSLVKLGSIYPVKDMSYLGKPMRTDSDTHYVKVSAGGSPTNAEHSFFEEFVIKRSDQILPLYIVGLRKVNRFVLWRDAKIDNSENGVLFAQMKERYSFNIYGSKTSPEALAVLQCKLADSSIKCLIVTNGADHGEQFARECRNIKPSVPIIVFCGNVAYHQQWAAAVSGSSQSKIQVTSDSGDVFAFINANFPSGGTYDDMASCYGDEMGFGLFD